MVTLFEETSYDLKCKINHKCDDIYKLIKYPKNKTINEMRRDLYIEKEMPNDNISELIKSYTEIKNNHYIKEKNKELYILLYNEKMIYLHKLLELKNIIKFNSIPNCFKIQIINARFVWDDGNSMCFIGESESDYYVIKWYGS